MTEPHSFSLLVAGEVPRSLRLICCGTSIECPVGGSATCGTCGFICTVSRSGAQLYIASTSGAGRGADRPAPYYYRSPLMAGVDWPDPPGESDKPDPILASGTSRETGGGKGVPDRLLFGLLLLFNGVLLTILSRGAVDWMPVDGAPLGSTRWWFAVTGLLLTTVLSLWGLWARWGDGP